LLDDLGLVSALRWYIQRQSKRIGVDIQLALDPHETLPSRLPPDIETASFRIVQEALTNIARHAEASQVTVELRLRDGFLELAIKDDGVGFDVRAARERASMGGSMGLLGMQERAELVRGHLAIESTTGRGTRGTIVRVWLPLDQDT
jgi:signal transduction histidine kinase